MHKSNDMMKMKKCSLTKQCMFLVFQLQFIFLVHKCNATTNIVKSLPGFPTTLPFKLETGYISVGENDEVELFYYFLESERDPSSDPLLVWLTGGPGCAGFFSFIYTVGPLKFNMSSYDGGVPSLVLNPYSWSKVANVIIIDSPVGTGFSYATTSEGYASSDIKATKDKYTFMRKWLLKRPSFIRNPLYIGGDSYAAVMVPLLALEIEKGNEHGLHPRMALEGYIIGNARPDARKDDYEKILYAHRMGIISDEYFELAKRSCQEEFVNPDPNNHQCLHALGLIKQCINLINEDHILEPRCTSPEPKLPDSTQSNIFSEDVPDNSLFLTRQEEKSCHRDYYDSFYQWDNNVTVDVDPKCVIPEPRISQLEHISLEDVLVDSTRMSIQERPKCRKDDYWRSYVWNNDENVREALHIRKDTVAEWVRCNYSISYEHTVESVFKHHQYLTNKGYRLLAYSGDHDLCVPYTSTLKWIRDLNLTIDKAWRPWTVEGQVAGYAETYKDDNNAQITFATVKGAGHTGPEYKPKECLAMVSRWFSQRPL